MLSINTKHNGFHKRQHALGNIDSVTIELSQDEKRQLAHALTSNLCASLTLVHVGGTIGGIPITDKSVELLFEGLDE